MIIKEGAQWALDRTVRLDELIIKKGAKVTAPEGHVVCMTVDNVLQDAAEGEYRGDIVIYILEEMKEDIAKEERPQGGPGGPGGPDGPGGPPMEHRMPQKPIYVNYISALVMDENGVAADRSAAKAFKNGRITEEGIDGGEIVVKGSRRNVLLDENGSPLAPAEKFDKDGNRIYGWITDYDVGVYNALTILGGEKRVEGLKIRYDGNGGDDFHLYGCAVAVANDASVVLDGVDIETRGVIAAAVSSAGTSRVLVKDSRLVTKGTANTTWFKYNDKGMTSAAWVLAGRGTVRCVNALGASAMEFWRTYGESNGWGVYSGDEAFNLRQYIVDSEAVIPSEGDPGYEEGDFGAGYAVYALSNTECRILGSRFCVPDYAVIVAGGNTTHYIGSSTYDNLMALVGKDSLLYRNSNGFKDIEEKPTAIRSDHYGVLWHSSCGGTLNILPGTELYVGDTAFLIKGSQILTNSPVINVNAAVIGKIQGAESGRLKVVHLMESDDAGQTDEIALHHDYKWAICHMVLEKHGPLPGGIAATVTANFKDMSIDGDFFNSVNSARQLLRLSFDNTKVTGVISSSEQEHVYKSYYYGMKDGKRICIDEKGTAYVSITEKPYTLRSMNGATVENVYVHPAVKDGAFVYDKNDTAVYPAAGYAVYYTDARYIGKVNAWAAETVNNPVTAALKNGTVWYVTGDCYLSGLSIDASSMVNGGILYVNGVETPAAAGEYTGNIFIKASGR